MYKGIVINAVVIMGEVIGYLIWARILVSIFIRSSSNPIYNFLVAVTEPILGPLRVLQFKIFKSSMLDFSPILAWVLIDYIVVPMIVKLVNYIMI